MKHRLIVLGLTVFRVLPPWLRRFLVRSGTPSFTVGCVAVLRNGGEVLMLKQRHRSGWTLPGGLIKRNEEPLVCVRREVAEEIGFTGEIPDQVPLIVVDPKPKRIDLIYVVELTERPTVAPGDAEVVELGWRRIDDPDLNPITRQVFDVSERCV